MTNDSGFIGVESKSENCFRFRTKVDGKQVVVDSGPVASAAAAGRDSFFRICGEQPSGGFVFASEAEADEAVKHETLELLVAKVNAYCPGSAACGALVKAGRKCSEYAPPPAAKKARKAALSAKKKAAAAAGGAVGGDL